MKKKVNYPEQRKKAGKVPCPICGKDFPARGVKTHLRLKHSMKVTDVTKVITRDITQVITQVKGAKKGQEKINLVTRDITQVTPNGSSKPIQDPFRKFFLPHHNMEFGTYDEMMNYLSKSSICGYCDIKVVRLPDGGSYCPECKRKYI